MSGVDTETKRKLREMGAAPLLEALEVQEENLVVGMGFEDRLRLVVDEAHSSFSHAKASSAGHCATPARTYAPWTGSMNAAWTAT